MYNLKNWYIFLQLISLINIFLLIKLDVNNIYIIIYALCCIYRSLNLAIYDKRYIIHNIYNYNIFTNRLIATIGELCCGFQLYLLFNKFNNILINKYSIYIFIISIISNILCWIGILTTNQLYHILEETGWTLIGILILYFSSILTLNDKKYSIYLILALIYVLYMIYYDIPFIKKKYLKDINNNKKYLSLNKGFKDMFICNINHDYNEWKDDLVWQTLYYSFGVWILILSNINL